MEPKKLSTESYKGVRDFYPEDMFVQNFIFNSIRKTVESFGYSEYTASVLEPAELYRSKTSDEIVNEQTYTFTDRGEREVTLRPEMTPTVARMIAGRRRELTFPVRWYSIPNCFRYEKPQRGRLREFWQLNVDMFGANSIEADLEMISLASTILTNFGIKKEQFEILVNSRAITNAVMEKVLMLDTEKTRTVSRLIDRIEKMPREEFKKILVLEIGDTKADSLLEILSVKNPEALESMVGKEIVAPLQTIIEQAKLRGIESIRFSPTLMRGFDYYTGMVFEVFDTNPENRRSLFGGGRFDNLTGLFDNEPIPAVGFAMGDVILRDVLETYNLLPAYTAPTQLFLATTDENKIPSANQLAMSLREKGIGVSVNLSSKKIGDQIKSADRQKIPFVIVLGDDEIASKTYSVKNLATGEENKVTEEILINTFFIK